METHQHLKVIISIDVPGPATGITAPGVLYSVTQLAENFLLAAMLDSLTAHALTAQSSALNA